MWLDVKNYGAVGDGVTDDYAAIAAALNASRKTTSQYGGGTKGAVVYFPPGVYRITQPLNCTGGQFNLRGDGAFNSVIRGDTGAGHAIVEMVGSTFSSIHDLLLDTVGMANPSTVGVFLGRVKDSAGNAAQSQNINLIDTTVSLHSNPAANNGHGTVAIYNHAAEITDYYGVYVRGDTAAVLTGWNIFGLNSVHRPSSAPDGLFTGDASMTVVSVSGNSSLVGLAGPALHVAGGGNFYVNAYLATQGATPYTYAINVTGQTTDFEYHGSMEGFPGLLRSIGFIRGLRLHAYCAYDTTVPRILLDADPLQQQGGGLHNSIIDVVPTPESYVSSGGQPAPATGYLIDSSPNWIASVAGSIVYLRSAKIRMQNNWPETYFRGNFVIAENNLADVVINVPNRSGNTVQALDGLETDGPKLGLGSTAAASTLGSVVRKVEVFDRSGASLGFVPVYNSIT